MAVSLREVRVWNLVGTLVLGIASTVVASRRLGIPLGEIGEVRGGGFGAGQPAARRDTMG